VDHPTAGHLARGGLDRLSQADRRPLFALGLHRAAAGPRDRTRHPAAVAELGVGRVGDCVDLEAGDIGLPDFDLGHLAAEANGGE
jgi:hypothetical protein